MTNATRAGAGLGLALFSSVAFGLSGPFAKALLDAGWSPSAAVLLRVGTAAAVLVAIALLVVRRPWPLLRRRGASIVVFGVVAVAAAQLCFFSAVQYLPVGVALMIEYTAPVLIIGWLWARTRRRPSVLVLGGAAIALAGLALVLELGSGVGLHPVGVLWALAAAVALAVYFVIASRPDDGTPPILTAAGGMTVGAATIAVVAATGLLPVRASWGEAAIGEWQTSWAVPALLLVLVSTVAAYLTGMLAAVRLGPQTASFVALTEVLAAVLASWLLLAEQPGWSQALGGALIIAGVVLVREPRWPRRGGRQRLAQPPRSAVTSSRVAGATDSP